jgi:hypothetical protein
MLVTEDPFLGNRQKSVSVKHVVVKKNQMSDFAIASLTYTAVFILYNLLRDYLVKNMYPHVDQLIKNFVKMIWLAIYVAGLILLYYIYK